MCQFAIQQCFHTGDVSYKSDNNELMDAVLLGLQIQINNG